MYNPFKKRSSDELFDLALDFEYHQIYKYSVNCNKLSKYIYKIKFWNFYVRFTMFDCYYEPYQYIAMYYVYYGEIGLLISTLKKYNEVDITYIISAMILFEKEEMLFDMTGYFLRKYNVTNQEIFNIMRSSHNIRNHTLVYFMNNYNCHY